MTTFLMNSLNLVHSKVTPSTCGINIRWDVQTALDYIAAEKIPDWNEHLHTFADILCYAFAYDRPNYARWGPVYLAEMFLLPETAPEVQNFLNGNHAVSRSQSNFSTVWSDLGLGQTIVRDSKSKQGGIIGISRQEKATLKWYLTVHERSAVVRNFKSMCGIGNLDEQIHHDLKESIIQKDTEDVQKITSIVLEIRLVLIYHQTTKSQGHL